MRIRNLNKSYGGTVVFRHVDLELEKGGIYCLMAPSGAGKTTLLRILMGLERADSGEIIPDPGTEGVAAVFQEDRLCPGLGVEKNILLVNPVCTGARLREEVLRLLPEDCLGKPVFEFSGGMRRRAALLRALLSRGGLLLLDEPFGGLDEAVRRASIDYVKEKRCGRTLLLATHHVEEAEALGARRILWQTEEQSWKLV